MCQRGGRAHQPVGFGCRRHCPNCFNAVAWDFSYGEPFTKKRSAIKFWRVLPRVTSMVFRCWAASPLSRRTSGSCCLLVKTSRCCTPTRRSGATPATIFGAGNLAARLRALRGDRRVLTIYRCALGRRLREDKYDISLRFRGSSNQRIIDMNKTRAAGRVVLWQDDPIFADHKM